LRPVRGPLINCLLRRYDQAIKTRKANVMSSNTFVSLLIGAALAAACAGAQASDFVFGEDFEGVPACAGTGFFLGVTPELRSTSLDSQVHYLAKLRACGTSGLNLLSQTDGPSGWTYAIDPPTLSPPADTIGIAEITVTVPTSGDTGAHFFHVAADSAGGPASSGAALDVSSVYVMHFAPDGTGSGPHVFPPSLAIKVGTTLRLFDDDTVTIHRIHGDGVLTHQQVDMTAGQYYDITPSMPGGGQLYCHSHGTGNGVTAVTVVP
jgi:hypothetical protein